MMMQSNLDTSPRACTAIDTASGVDIVCTMPGLIQGATPDIFLCAAHAQRDATAAQKLKVLQQRQRSNAQGAGAGPANPGAGFASNIVASSSPSIFNFNVVAPGSPPGSIHSFFRVPKVSSIPTGFGDNFDFGPHAAAFPVANAILGGIKYEVAEVKRLLIAALRSDTSVSFPEMSDAPFPYGVPLPVAIFLNPPVGADSVVSLLETIGTMMWREWDGRFPAFLAEYQSAVAECEEAADEGDEGAAAAASSTSASVKTAWIPSLMDRMDTFFIMLEKCISTLWQQELQDEGTRLLPWPKTAAALGSFASIDHAEDLLMSLGHSPPAHKSAWRPFVVLNMLEDTLATGGFPDEAPDELEDMSLRDLLRFFERCVRDNSPRKRHAGANPLPPRNVPHRPSAGGGSGAGGFSSGFFGGFSSGGITNNVIVDYTCPSGGAPSGIDIGAGPTEDPDQRRRNQAEAFGRRSQVGVPNRSEATVEMDQVLQDGFDPMAQMKQVHGHMTSELMQRRLAMGLEADGSGNYCLSKAPVDVRKAIITNSGDAKRKLGLGMEGGALAPGAMGNLQDTVQTGMSNDGFSVTFEECKYLVMCQFHKIHPRAFNPCGIGQGVVGADTDSLVKAKSHPNISTYTPTGPEVMSLINGIIAARSLFDAVSPLQADLHQVKLRLERANRTFLTVENTWKALRSTFQCFSQALNSWAKSPQAITEPRLTDSLPAADFLWGAADAQAFLLPKLDPAWAAQTDAGAGRGGNKFRKGTDLSSLSPHERRSIAAELRKLGPSTARTPGNTSSTPATGDGKLKTKGSPLWPDHIRVVCEDYKAGKDCGNGADCHRYCYLSKDRSCFSN